MRPIPTLSERDRDRITRLFDERGEDDCWKWLGYVGANGYGYLRIGGRRGPLLLAHRVIYSILVGAIPDGLTLDHLCRDRACVNPRHLEPVTNRENILRGESPAADHARQTHCVYGHEFTIANTRVGKDGKRSCRRCNRERQRERYARS